MTGPKRKSVKFRDGQFSYLDWASPGPALHFAHATGFNGNVYRNLLGPLAGNIHLLASDLRGHGFTTLPTDGAAEWTRHESDLKAFLDSIHPGPLVLAGHSMGAIISLMVAARWPERVRALVLVEPVLVPPKPDTKLGPAEMPGANEPERAGKAARRRSHFATQEEAFTAYRGRGAFKSWPDEVLRDYLRGGLVPSQDGRELRLSCSPAWEAATFRATPLGAARLVQTVSCPVSVLVGAHGSTAAESQLNVLRDLHLEVHVLHVPDTTHFLPMERPAIVREEITRVLHAL